MASNKKVSIKDIAAEAGVSTATVSYVLNRVEKKSISADTRDRIFAAAKRLNYVPNEAARLLRTGATKCISVRLTNTLSVPRFHSMLEGIRDCLSEHGYTMLISDDSRAGTTSKYIEACLSAKADGILYISTGQRDIPDDELECICRYGIPVSAVDCTANAPLFSSTIYDYYSCSARRVAMLHQNGVRRLLYLTPAAQRVGRDQRLHGLHDAATQYGMQYEIERFPLTAQRENSRSVLSNVERILRGHSFDIQNVDSLQFQLEPDGIASLKEIVFSATADTGILSSARSFQYLINDFLYKKHLLGINQGQLPWHALSVSYAFPHYNIGYEAAQSLVDTLEGRPPRNLSFQAHIIPIDPKIY